MKPVELVERSVKNSSKSRDTVLDLFGGSGTTLIACEKTNRQARLMELDPKYVDVIIKRWEDYTGNKAVRSSDGASLEQARLVQAGLLQASLLPASVSHENDTGAAQS
jgi:DNA modification methylase